MKLEDAPPFLSAEALSRELAKYEYRPGWKLSIFTDRWEGPCLYVVADVINGYRRDETVEIRVRSAIPPIPTPEYFAVWLQWRLLMIEIHECMELFHKDGKPVFDPHDVLEP